jgi:hypothetical protein
MAKESLFVSRLATQPWSDAYWPFYRGNIAWRYGDTKFPNSRDFIKNYNYLWLSPLLRIGSANPKKYDTLSPAEKYDLLVGDSGRSLTAAALKSGKRYYDSEKKVAYWMGICHGWAAASYMTPRPSKEITVTAVDGITKINFYPSDIKALSSFLWANAKYHSRFAGGRCDQVNPKKNKYGRIIDQNCFDTNPGTWHLSVVNQIGISQRSLIMDSTYDHEVWNQPIYSYEYSYFNPSTLKATKNLNEAAVPLRTLKKDKYREYRSPKTVSVVGVAMTLIYMAETHPKKALNDNPSADRKIKVTYLYDLELDSTGNIIGGEWYQNAHPDFLWSPDKGIRLLSKYDAELEKNAVNWDTSSPIPRVWADYARRSSQVNSLPLTKIIEALSRN